MSSTTPWEEGDKLSLASIRETLIRQEDTIIFALIERAQFAHNPETFEKNSQIYNALTGGSSVDSKGMSLLDYMLLEQERSHSRIRRYTSPDEHAFFPDLLPAPMLPLIEFPEVLHPNLVNLNSTIMDMYTDKVLPDLCRAGDDGQHGSSVVADIAVLQAISKRVHYGFFVAESKFLAQTAEFSALIEACDEPEIMKLLTHAAVEEKVLRRVRLKASTFGQELEAPPPASSASSPVRPSTAAAPAAGGGPSARVDPELIVRLYREQVIPLTKVAEVQYLLQRLTPANVAHHGGEHTACARAAAAFIARGAPSGKRAPRLVRCPNAADVFEQVSSNKAFHGVALLEQGDSGILSTVRDLLKANSLRIVGEVLPEARFRLVSRGGSLADVRKVVARADVLRLCRAWLQKVLVGSVELEETTSTNAVVTPPPAERAAGAKRAAAEMSGGNATERTVAYLVETHAPLAAELSVLATAPEDVVEVARCAVIAKSSSAAESAPTDHDRTILYFSLKQDQAGGLAAALDALNKHGVNLLSIRSYADLVDANTADIIVTTEGHEKDASLAAAISQLKKIAAEVKVFGSFPRADRGPS